MFQGKTSLSVREPMIALVSLILLLGFLITNISYYYVSKNSLKETLINELPLTSNNIYSEIQRDLLRPIFISSLMANDTFVKDWLTEGERGTGKIVRYLDEIRQQYGVFTSFLISENTLNYYHFSGLSRKVHRNVDNDAWYFRVRDMATDYEINVDLNAEQNNALTIFINYKVKDAQGQYLGATGVGLNFNTVANIVSRYEQNFGHHVYFMDGDGQIAIRSNQAFIETNNLHQAPGISAIAASLLQKGENFAEYDNNGTTMLVSSRYIPELDWWVLVEYDEAIALAPLRNSLYVNMLVGLVVVLLTILITNYTINRFHRRLEDLASQDKLTQAGNRNLFDLMLPQALAERKKSMTPCSVILIDIDHFKAINDHYGHIEGDRVLRAIADVIRQHIRDTDLLCRWGGEELIVLAYNCKLDPAQRMAETIRTAIAEANIIQYEDGSPITVSCGVTEAQETDDQDNLIRRADEALYQAKGAGRNCTRLMAAV